MNPESGQQEFGSGGIERRRFSEELYVEETNPIQEELAKRMGKDLGEWILEYGERFRMLINGHDGSYDIRKDTRAASGFRDLYRNDPELFFQKIQDELEKTPDKRQLH